MYLRRSGYERKVKLVEVGEDQERSLEGGFSFPSLRGPQIPTYSLGWEKAFRIPQGEATLENLGGGRGR